MRIIAGRWGGRTLTAPRGRTVRPTTDRVREAWMSALHHDLADARVLDVFAGSGALGLEALSRGAKFATFVESSASAVAALRANVVALEAEDRVRVVRQNAFAFLSGSSEMFDLALADPPYERGLATRLAEAYLERPFAAALWIEHSRRETLPAGPDTRTRRYGDTLLTTYEGSHG